MANIGKRIKERREELGLSQEELAQKLGYKNKSTIAKIEAGVNDIVLSKVVTFAKALETTLGYLMGWDESSESRAQTCYLNPEAAKKAQEMYEDPDMRTLFDIKKNISPEIFETHIKFMRELYKKDYPSDEYRESAR